MKKFEKEAVKTAISWNDDGFNNRNKEICTDLLNFPHVRLWKNKFSIFNNKEDFLEGFDDQTKRLKEEGIWIVGASSNSKARLYDFDLKGPVAFILGGEEKGLRQSTERHCDIVCKIPMMNEVESLNVSVATGIYLFETLRQRL